MEQLQAPEITISYKSKVKASERIKITTSKDVYDLSQKLYNADTIEYTEESIVLLLNMSNKIIGYFKISQGSIEATVVDVRTVALLAIKTGATGVILTHNHPSGNTRPSNTDIELTRRIKNGLQFLDIKLIDHIIITSESYYSFADEGTL